MTADQYQAILQELARVARVPDPSALIEAGRIEVSGHRALLVHEPDYDPHLLQVRIVLGAFPLEHREAVALGLLEANYLAGYGGEWVYSLLPETKEAVLTIRLPLVLTPNAQELWRLLSECVQQAGQMWESLLKEKS
jgi:hypothetical protein